MTQLYHFEHWSLPPAGKQSQQRAPCTSWNVVPSEAACAAPALCKALKALSVNDDICRVGPAPSPRLRKFDQVKCLRWDPQVRSLAMLVLVFCKEQDVEERGGLVAAMTLINCCFNDPVVVASALELLRMLAHR